METDYWAHQYLADPDRDNKEVEDADLDIEEAKRALEENPDDWETIIDG